MRDGIEPGLKHRFEYVVPENKTVPHLFPEAPDFQTMPAVFATGFMVGLMEWTCIQLMQPFLEPGEGSLGVHVDVSHAAATPAGLKVVTEVEVASVEGRRIGFYVKARDNVDLIGKGRHERFVVAWERFRAGVAGKSALVEVSHG